MIVATLAAGVEKTLDILQSDGAVNTLFVATFTYGRGIAGRRTRGSRQRVGRRSNMVIEYRLAQ